MLQIKNLLNPTTDIIYGDNSKLSPMAKKSYLPSPGVTRRTNYLPTLVNLTITYRYAFAKG